MPKTVDHDERRRVMAEAILDIAARSGLGSVSVGNVAAEIGVSKGAVQHYFSTKSDMLSSAARLLRVRIDSRLAGRSTVESILLALVPQTEADRRDAAAGHALFAYSLSDTQLREMYIQGRTAMRKVVADLLGSKDETTARLLLGLVADIGESVLLGELDYEAARALITDAIVGHGGEKSPSKPP